MFSGSCLINEIGADDCRAKCRRLIACCGMWYNSGWKEVTRNPALERRLPRMSQTEENSTTDANLLREALSGQSLALERLLIGYQGRLLARISRKLPLAL